MNEIKVRKIEGLTTIFDFNSESIDYQSFLGLKKLWKEGGDYRIAEIAGKFFEKFIMREYLNKIGICLRKENPILVWEDDRIDFYGKGIKVISGEENYLEGYESGLEIHTTSDSLIANGFLIRSGTNRLRVLEDFLKLFPCGDGIEKPIVSFEKDSAEQPIIRVASIEQIPKVVGIMKQIYESIEGSVFNRLVKLSERRNESKEKSLKVVEKEYNQRLEKILSVNLF